MIIYRVNFNFPEKVTNNLGDADMEEGRGSYGHPPLSPLICDGKMYGWQIKSCTV